MRCVGQIGWSAYAWTGSPSSPSQSFTLESGSTTSTGFSLPSCTIRMATQPADAFIGSLITHSALNEGGPSVTVQLSPPPGAGKTVSLDSDACDIHATVPVDPNSGVATFSPSSTLKSMLTTTAAETTCQLTPLTRQLAINLYLSPALTQFKVVLKAHAVWTAVTLPSRRKIPLQVPKPSGTRLNNVEGDCGDPIPYALYWARS